MLSNVAAIDSETRPGARDAANHNQRTQRCAALAPSIVLLMDGRTQPAPQDAPNGTRYAKVLFVTEMFLTVPVV